MQSLGSFAVSVTSYQIPCPQLVSKNQVSRFINAQPELQIKQNYKFHSWRAKYEDLKIKGPQFKFIEETHQAQSILNKDTYNFNKTRYIIGITIALKVITSSNTIGCVITIQLGNYKQVIAIKAVNITRESILLFIILVGKLY